MEENKIIEETNNDRCYTVYMHTSPSGKRYIGLTKQTVEERWKNGWGYYTQLIFYRAILKYSFENFKHEIMAYGLSKEEAINLEKELIKKYKTTDRKYGYNVTEGGETMSPNCHWKDSHHTEEAKMKISAANKGRPRPDAAERNKGNNYSSFQVYQYKTNGEYVRMYQSTRDVERVMKIIHNKISDCCRNKCFSVGGYCWSYLSPDLFSIEDKRNEVDNYLNNKELNNRKNKKVVQYDKTTLEIIGVYKSISDASIVTGIHKSAISNCVTEIAKTAGGFIWAYSDKELTEEYLNRCLNNSKKPKLWKAVCQYTKDGNFIKKYDSITIASLETGISHSNINSCCSKNGKQQSAGNFIWRYASDIADPTTPLFPATSPTLLETA